MWTFLLGHKHLAHKVFQRSHGCFAMYVRCLWKFYAKIIRNLWYDFNYGYVLFMYAYDYNPYPERFASKG